MCIKYLASISVLKEQELVLFGFFAKKKKNNLSANPTLESIQVFSFFMLPRAAIVSQPC